MALPLFIGLPRVCVGEALRERARMAETNVATPCSRPANGPRGQLDGLPCRPPNLPRTYTRSAHIKDIVRRSQGETQKQQLWKEERVRERRKPRHISGAGICLEHIQPLRHQNYKLRESKGLLLTAHTLTADLALLASVGGPNSKYV